MVKRLYNTRERQGDLSCNRSEENKAIFTHLFFEYFDHVVNCENSPNNSRIARQRYEHVNRSLVGQQAALSSTEDAQLLNTILQHEIIRGTGEVDGEVTVSELSASDSVASSLVGKP